MAILNLQRYFGYTRLLATGAPAPNATITVFKPIGTGVHATIYSDRFGTPLGNPFTSNADGFFFFYALPGEYDVRFTGGGIASPYTWGDVVINVSPSEVIDAIDGIASLNTEVHNALYGWFNPRNFGAVGDFITDDTQAFQDCIAAAASMQGSIYIPQGLYLNTQTLDFANGVSMTVAGASRDTTQLMMATKGAGTVSAVLANTTITGVGTSFTTFYVAGDSIIYGGTAQVVASVTDDTHLELIAGSLVTSTSIYYRAGLVPGAQALKFGTQKYFQLRDLSIIADPTGRVSHTNYHAGNHAVIWDGSFGVCTDIHDVEFIGFGDSTIYIKGPTASTTVRNCAISLCERYGVLVSDVTGQAPQDITVQDTSIHRCRGGVSAAGCSSVDLVDLDIELAAFATFPAINIDTGVALNDTNGVSVKNCSISLSTTPVPAAAVYINGYGCTVEGGRNEVNGAAVASNIAISGPSNVIIGGFYDNNVAGTGYFATTTGINLFNVFIGCRVLTHYAAGHNIVYDTTFPGARTTTVGVSGRSGAGFSMLDNAAFANTVTASVATPSTNKMAIDIGGMTYYILLTT